MSEHETEVILDKAHFRRIVSESNSDDTVNKLADAFSIQATQIASDISALLNSGDTTEQSARSLLHRLQGSSEVIGAQRLSYITRSVLNVDQGHFYPALQSALPSLLETIEETLIEIRKWPDR